MVRASLMTANTALHRCSATLISLIKGGADSSSAPLSEHGDDVVEVVRPGAEGPLTRLASASSSGTPSAVNDAMRNSASPVRARAVSVPRRHTTQERAF